MNIRYFSSLLTLITFIFCQPSLAQSLTGLEVQKLFIENQSILENVPAQNTTQEINTKPTSENQNVANSLNTRQLDLTNTPIQNTPNGQSLSNRYFKALTGQNLNIYGLNEFNQQQNENLLFFNVIGKDYKLGPGDTIQIIITGLSSLNKTFQVMNDGTISLENIYPFNVSNITLDQVSKLILDKVMLDDASAEVLVRLNTARLVTVQISGNVNYPKTIAVPAYTPLSRAIGYSGGISDSGSLRNISLSQIGETTQTVDFYNFLQNPSPKTDPLIKNGARIFVPFKGSIVAVTGFVNNPGIYELPQNKSEISIENLLRITGTSFLPSGAKLKVSYFDSSGRIATRLAVKNESLKEGEALQIGFIETRDLNISKISGAVLKDFEIKTNTPLSIKEVLKNGAVLSLDAYTSFALIVGKEVQAINLDNALEDDSITLPIGSDLRLFTKKEYLGLLDSDPSKSLDSLASKFIESNVTEIYLGAARIAYVPLSRKQKLYNIKEVLRGGSILNEDGYLINNNIYTSFALIVGKEVQAINLDDALEDDSITLPVGSDLRLFTKEQYLALVASDPNKSLDPLVSKFVESNVAEIYLNGARIAYIPVGQDQKFNDSIKSFYIPSPKTVFDLALIENNTDVKAFDLKLAMDDDHNLKLVKGDKLLIFEDKFFNQLIGEQVDGVFNDLGNTEGSANPAAVNMTLEAHKLQQDLKNKKLRYSENVEYSKKLLQKSDITKISLDGELFTILPFSKSMTSSYILNKLRGKLPKLTNDFVIVQNTDINSKPKIKNLNHEFLIKQNQNINLISQGTYRKIINSYNTTGETALTYDVKESDAVKVYYDQKLVLLLSPNLSVSDFEVLNTITETDNFYKLYIGLITKQKNNENWYLQSYDARSFFDKTNDIVLKSTDVINLFSEQYIRNRFTKNNKSVILNSIVTDIVDNETETTNINLFKDKSFSYIDKVMNSNLRVVSGSVIFPGSYPVAEKISLSDLIDVVGVIETKAASNIILTKSIKENNTLIKVPSERFQLNSPVLDEIILSGEYVVDIPKAVNLGTTGFVSLTGEFMIPGDYSFTRSETLDKIIKRAGGLSEVAYPLGAILQRESIKAQEKETNAILASQLEASVLTLAQSDVDGVGEQIQAVLGFSQQLRNQPTAGRMTLNIMDSSRTGQLYLQDGDKLMVPKRPSHVSVVGAVQRTTVASYSKNKNFIDYINAAGGLTKMADVRKSYVLLPNGESRILNNTTIIPVGSVIVVPPRIDKLSILGLTDIISRVMGNIATSVLAINNVN